jgi:hypothetical protein
MSQLRGRPFQPGNTFGRGRPKGSRNKTTRKMHEMLDRYLEPITQKLISMALKGDPGALRLCVERLFPAQRDGYVQIPLPRINGIADIQAAQGKVMQAIAGGQITPMQGEILSGILEDRRRSIETVEMEARIEKLEQSDAGKDQNGEQ